MTSSEDREAAPAGRGGGDLPADTADASGQAPGNPGGQGPGEVTAPATSGASPRGAAVLARGFGWQHPGRDAPAFSGLDLEIPPGQKVLLLGPSGAGKSTLLHALAGVLSAEEGDEQQGVVEIDGVHPSRCRGRVGLMQQDPEASIVLSRVAEDLAFGPENLAVPRELIPARSAEALAAVGLDLASDHSTSALSGGQKQRLGLAGILAMRPGLLLLDEPTANLDPAGVIEVRDAVVRAAREYGSTLVVVEHRVRVWAEHVDRIVVMRPGGGVSHDGPPARVLAEARQELIQAGVWVPGHVPRIPAAIDSEPADPAAPDAAAAGLVAPDAVVLEPTAEEGSPADPASAEEASPVLLRAHELAVTRDPARRRWLRARRRVLRAHADAGLSDTGLPEAGLPGAAPEASSVASGQVPAPGPWWSREPWAREAIIAASGIRAVVRAGEHLAVVGPNGAGKSTFALTLAGLLAPASGVVVAGEALRRPRADPAGEDGREAAGSSRSRGSGRSASAQIASWDPVSWDSQTLIERIGTVFQDPEQQFVRSTVREELELGPRLSGDPDPAATAERLLRRLSLTAVAEANPFTLSGGEKRRLSVGTALAAGPRVLVLDEPTFGQDARTWAALVALLREVMAGGTAVVSVTHDADFVQALGGDRLELSPEGSSRPAEEPPSPGPDDPASSEEGTTWTS